MTAYQIEQSPVPANLPSSGPVDAGNFEIPAFRLPTEAELTPRSIETVRRTSAFWIENWLPALTEAGLAVGGTGIALSRMDISLLLRNVVGDESSAESLALFPFEQGALDDLLDRLNKASLVYPEGAFWRLGSRSAKDADISRADAGDTKAIMERIGGFSERLYLDLSDAWRANAPMWAWARPWIQDSPAREWRVFIEDGQFKGASASDAVYRDPILDAAATTMANLPGFREALESIALQASRTANLPCVTVDVFAMPQTIAPPAGVEFGEHRITVLELNPAWSMGMTHPLAFRNEDLDGSIRPAMPTSEARHHNSLPK